MTHGHCTVPLPNLSHSRFIPPHSLYHSFTIWQRLPKIMFTLLLSGESKTNSGPNTLHATSSLYKVLQLAPEPENGFHILQYDRTGTNMFYEWSLKKRCIR